MAHHDHHISSPQLLITTFLALVALTILTCVMAMLPLDSVPLQYVAPMIFDAPQDLSWLDMPITLVIATVKAALVAVIFMHLQHDKLINSIVLIGSVVFLVLFVGMVLMDSNEYQPQVGEYLYEQEAVAAP